MNPRELFILVSIALLAVISGIYIVIGPIIILGYADILQKKHTIKRNFPVVGDLRYLLEKVRPEIMQYFVETDTDGTPINRLFRSLIYQRAKKVNDTTPLGTRVDVFRAGYEWMDHSIYAKNHTLQAF